MGHIQKYCYKWKRDNKGGNNSDRAATATCDDLVIVYDDDMVNLANYETSWVIDSGISLHVISRKEFFTSYMPGDFGVLKRVMMACQRLLAWEMSAW